jgi:hypothetical protein
MRGCWLFPSGEILAIRGGYRFTTCAPALLLGAAGHSGRAKAGPSGFASGGLVTAKGWPRFPLAILRHSGHLVRSALAVTAIHSAHRVYWFASFINGWPARASPSHARKTGRHAYRRATLAAPAFNESAEVSFRPRAGVARASAGRVRPDLGRSPSPQDGLTAALPRLPPKSAAAWAGQGIGTNLLHR